MQESTVVLVGAGNMGLAMLEAWVNLPGQQTTFLVVEPDSQSRDRALALGARTAESIGKIEEPSSVELVVFAVKPQVINTVLPLYRDLAPKAVFLSVAAGVPIKQFEAHLGTEAKIIRAIPNTPAAICKGMTVAVTNKNVTTCDWELAQTFLNSNGAVYRVEDESLMDAATAVSGSGPAYLFHFIECLAEAAREVGLPAEAARLLAQQTVYGAACLAETSEDDAATLREKVTSPGGTTQAALEILMGENGLKPLLTDAVKAATARSIELGKSQSKKQKRVAAQGDNSS